VQPRGINNGGQIVGSGGGAYVWHQGMPFDLNAMLASNPLGVTLTGAADINNNGQIIAYGTSSSIPSNDLAFRIAILLTPAAADDAATAAPAPTPESQHGDRAPAQRLTTAAAVTPQTPRPFGNRIIEQLDDAARDDDFASDV
jgi:hypothetical protein